MDSPHYVYYNFARIQYRILINLNLTLITVTGAYAVSLFVDKFLSTDVDVAIIRMIEGLNQGGRPKQTPTILKGLQEDERLRVLERVLDSRVSSR